MQGTKIRLLAGGLLMMATAGYVQADALQPDPAWQQGTLSNGLQWQVLTTPQRPSDRVEIRLLVNTRFARRKYTTERLAVTPSLVLR